MLRQNKSLSPSNYISTFSNKLTGNTTKTKVSKAAEIQKSQSPRIKAKSWILKFNIFYLFLIHFKLLRKY